MESVDYLNTELNRVGELVLTEHGEMEHLYGGFGMTLCGRDVDDSRAQEDGTFFPCLTCQRASKSGKRVRAQRAIRQRINSLA